MCTVEVIGKSTEGRDIKVLKVSKDKTEKPGIWIDAGKYLI
jgi:murein tripeptide amidase MpaA